MSKMKKAALLIIAVVMNLMMCFSAFAAQEAAPADDGSFILIFMGLVLLIVIVAVIVTVSVVSSAISVAAVWIWKIINNSMTGSCSFWTAACFFCFTGTFVSWNKKPAVQDSSLFFPQERGHIKKSS